MSNTVMEGVGSYYVGQQRRVQQTTPLERPTRPRAEPERQQAGQMKELEEDTEEHVGVRGGTGGK